MTNEILAMEIQSGHQEQIEVLWLQVERFIHMQADKYLGRYPEHIRMAYKDDLYQCGYFALLDAVRTYQGDCDKSFIGWLTYHLRNHFNNVLGQRTIRDKKAPHNSAISLETLLQSDDDMTLGETIIDPNGESGYQSILDAGERTDINQFIMKALDGLPEDIRPYFLLYFSNGMDRQKTQVAFGLTMDQAYARYRKGIVYLRRWMERHKKERQVIGIDDTLSIGLRGGLGAYRRHGLISSTERAAMRRLEEWESERMIVSLI